MNDQHDPQTGEIDDDVMEGEIIEPISTAVVAAIHRAEIDGQVTTAKAYPRNLTEVARSLKALVTLNEDAAAECVYALPRGNKKIRGASAYFADALISLYGNARSESFVSAVNFDEMWVEAIGSFQDVERNVIRRRRTRRGIRSQSGNIYNADMINMTGNAACRIAERNAILNGIPKPLWSPAYDAAFALVAGTIQTLEAKRDRAFAAFNVMGVAPELVLEKLGRQDLGKIVLDDIVTLRGMLTALKSGEETTDTIFGRGSVSTHDQVKNPLRDEHGGNLAGDPSSPNKAQVTIDGRVVREKANDPISSGLERSETASNEAAKTDTHAQASGKAAEHGQAEPAVEGQSTKTNARPPASGQPTASYEQTADGYTGYMHDQFDKATSKAAIKEAWASTRDDRMALLDAEQLGELEKDRDAALKRIELKKGGAP